MTDRVNGSGQVESARFAVRKRPHLITCQGDVLSLGWCGLRSEYEQAGIAYEPGAVRVKRLEETLQIVKGLFAEGVVNFSGSHYTIKDLNGSPSLVGTPEQMCEDLLQRREQYGVSYIGIFEESMEAFAPVVARLMGK